RKDGGANAWVVPWKEPHERHEQQRGVERIRAVELREHAALVDAVRADVGVDLVRHGAPLLLERVLATTAREARASVERDPAEHLRGREVPRLAADLPDAAVGLVPVLDRFLDLR